MIRHRISPYLDELLFSESVPNMLIPYVEHIKVSPEFAKQDLVLLMNSIGIPDLDRALRVLGNNQIFTAFVVSHPINIFQILDLAFLIRQER
jgi:hypothetical protein